MSRRTTVIVIAAAAAVILLVVLWLPGNVSENEPGQGASSDTLADVPGKDARRPVDRRDALDDLAREARRGEPKPDDAAFSEYLRERYGKTISHGHTQIKAIEKLIAYLMRHYPDDWRERLLDMLRRAFPERAEELYEQALRLLDYNEWLQENRGDLARMSRRDRRDALWEKRRETFGEAAEEIWEVALRNERIYDALDKMAESPETAVEEKLDTYLDAIDEAYGERAGDFVQRRQTELMNRFLAVETVQDELHELPPDVRRDKLREVRRAMGLDEAALERWDELDTQRDAVWELGEQYMEQRERIVANSEGEEREQRLHELRERVFGPEQAEILRGEEESGFFRWGDRRVYGRE